MRIARRGGNKTSPELYSSTGTCDKGKGLEGDVVKKPEASQEDQEDGVGEKSKEKKQKTKLN